jgi:hypothetical protein
MAGRQLVTRSKETWCSGASALMYVYSVGADGHVGLISAHSDQYAVFPRSTLRYRRHSIQQGREHSVD